MPEISVIVPVYRVEAYLCRSVDSLLAQTFSDFEIILVDDGSPDNCPAICDAYALKEERITVIHQPNGGLSAARNAGIRAARGKFLAFVDSDDLVAPDFLSYLHTLLTESNADLSVCGTKRFAAEEELQGVSAEADAPVTHHTAREFFLMQLTPETEMGVWNKLFRRELFEDLTFVEGKLHEDIFLSAALVSRATRGVVFGRAEKHFYRQNPAGIMGTANKKCSPDRVEAARAVIALSADFSPAERDACLDYALRTPWLFVDGIYVRREFRANRNFLAALRTLLREQMTVILKSDAFSEIEKHRMRLFAKGGFRYGINAYARLLRVYFYRLIRRDAYKSGHGI